jgi:hypothetical protein
MFVYKSETERLNEKNNNFSKNFDINANGIRSNELYSETERTPNNYNQYFRKKALSDYKLSNEQNEQKHKIPGSFRFKELSKKENLKESKTSKTNKNTKNTKNSKSKKNTQIPNFTHQGQGGSKSSYFQKAFFNNKRINDNTFKHSLPSTTTLDFSYFSYQGSLTSPPCEEEILWFVSSKPLPIGYTTIEYFKDVLKNIEFSEDGTCIDSVEIEANVRQLQNQNNRDVSFYDSEVEFAKCYLEDTEEYLNEYHKQQKIEGNKSNGHFEKLVVPTTKYYYVNSDETSGVPGALNVSPQEAGVINFSRNKVKMLANRKK